MEDNITQSQKSFLSRMFMLGLLVGIILLCILRVKYYSFMGYQPSMHPGIAFYFIPILFPFLALVAMILEWGIGRFIYKPSSKSDLFYLGLIYATVIFWWVVPDHYYLFILINPIIFRILIGQKFKKNEI